MGDAISPGWVGMCYDVCNVKVDLLCTTVFERGSSISSSLETGTKLDIGVTSLKAFYLWDGSYGTSFKIWPRYHKGALNENVSFISEAVADLT